MKVLLCNTTDTGGGAAKAALRLLTGLNKVGVHAKMLVVKKETSKKEVLCVGDFYSNSNYFIRIYQKINFKIRNKIRNCKWLKYPNRVNALLHDIEISRLGNTLNKIDFDILHLHWIEGDFINFKELQKINKPIVWTLHGSFPFTGICHHLFCERYKSRCGKCVALQSKKEFDLSTEVFEKKRKRYKKLNFTIISPSDFLAKKAAESKLLGTRKIHVVPNGIDTNLFYPIEKEICRKALGLKEKKTILFGAYGSTKDENKGLQYFIESIEFLKEYYNVNELQILIFGDTLKAKSHIEIHSFGHVNNEVMMRQIYSSSDVMIVPSKHENLPYTIMESLSCATPVVAFNIGGIPDMIEHKKNGYLAEPYNTQDLASGIAWCLDNNPGNCLGVYAHDKVVESYALEKIAIKHIEIYQSLLKK